MKATQLRDLESEPIWKSANKIVEHVLAMLDDFPMEEKWETVSKLRGSGNNLLYNMAAAIGSGTIFGINYEWGATRKHAVSIRAFLHLANKRKLAKIEPEFMVELDKLIKTIDKEIKAVDKAVNAAEEEDTKRWQQRYDTWRLAAEAEDKVLKK